MKRIISILLVLAWMPSAVAELDIATALMRSTFQLKSKSGQTGTVFILGKQISTDKARADYVLVTAAHVLENIKDDEVTINFRKETGDTHVILPNVVPIRKGGQPLWEKHPDVDVAAMYVRIPRDGDISLLLLTFLASDEILTKYEVKPSDQVFALGFPQGVAGNPAGFPILRAGSIASYPLTPTGKTKTFLFDFEVFPGNSGGPVFLRSESRVYGGATHSGVFRCLLGLVSQQKNLTETVKSLDEVSVKVHPLKIAIVVHASLIKETIDMLPDKKRP